MASALSGAKEKGSRFRFLPPDVGDFPSLTVKQKRKTNSEVSFIDQKTGFKINKVEFAEYYVMRCTEPGKDLRKTNPFYVEIALNNQVGIGTSTSRLRDGSLLIQALNERQATKVLKMTLLGDIPVVVAEHATLNTCQGIIYCWDSQFLTEEEILNGLQGQGQKVVAVRQIKRKENSILVNTPSVVITFKMSHLPPTIKFGFYNNIKVKTYIPNPMKCHNCFKFGHSLKHCKSERICPICSQSYHDQPCHLQNKCFNCDGSHNNYSKECPKYKREYEIQKIRVVDRLSYPEAKSNFDRLYPTLPVQSYSTIIHTQISNQNIAQALPIQSSTVHSNPPIDRFIGSNNNTQQNSQSLNIQTHKEHSMLTRNQNKTQSNQPIHNNNTVIISPSTSTPTEKQRKPSYTKPKSTHTDITNPISLISPSYKDDSSLSSSSHSIDLDACAPAHASSSSIRCATPLSHTHINTIDTQDDID